MGLDGGAEERPADETPSRRHDQVTPATGPPTTGRVGDHEARVVHGNAQLLLGAERLLQAREAGVGVDQDRVQVAVGEHAGPLVMTCLIVTPGRQDVAQARDEERALRPQGAPFLEQRQQLLGELLSPEGKELRDDGPRTQVAKGTEDRRSPLALRTLHRAPGVAAHELSRGVEAERRQVDELDPRRTPQPAGHGTAVQEDDAESTRERPGEGERAHEVAHAEDVLAVEENGGFTHRRPS